MSLYGLGRNAVLAEQPVPTEPVDGAAAGKLDAAADKDPRKDLIGSLSEWIPGDFVVSYGLLLTAWAAVRESFLWLVVIAAASAFVYVVLGAFAETGFRLKKDRSAKAAKGLLIKAVAGFLVSVYVAIAIPRSGWYEFAWFADHEESWVLTGSIVAVALVFVLKGLQKRGLLAPATP